jgi:hypothetical protein
MNGRASLGLETGAGVVVALAGLATIALVVMAPALAAGFEYDDRADVLDNPAARPDSFVAALGVTNRPLVKATYALQRWVTGSAPRPFHAFNLALHLATTIAVFFLLRRLIGEPARPGRDLAAWLAAALWALHPAAVEAVAPIVGRSTLLASLLGLLAVSLVTAAGPPSRRAAIGAGALACAAALARETALVLPALTLLWQATVGAGERRRDALRRQLPVLAGTAAAALAIALSSRHRELVAFSLHERSPLAALRGNVRAVVDLLTLWLAPARVSVDPPQPGDLPWLAPGTLAPTALLLVAAALAAALRRRQPRVALGVGWTLLSLAPSNSILWRLDPVAPRALYLASIGLALLVALVLRTITGRCSVAPRPAWPRVAAAALVLALVAWPLAAEARAAHRRAALWAEPAALWQDAAAKAPERSRPWLNLGVELMLAGRLAAAETALARAVAIDPRDSNAHCALDALRARLAAEGRVERSISR